MQGKKDFSVKGSTSRALCPQGCNVLRMEFLIPMYTQTCMVRAVKYFTLSTKRGFKICQALKLVAGFPTKWSLSMVSIQSLQAGENSPHGSP